MSAYRSILSNATGKQFIHVSKTEFLGTKHVVLGVSYKEQEGSTNSKGRYLVNMPTALMGDGVY